jgi:hypothetical protein
VTNRLLFAGTALAAAGIAVAQTPAPHAPPPIVTPSAPETEAERAAVIARLATALEENFVFPDIAHRYAAALRSKAAAGGYANLGDAFAPTVEADLHAIYQDRHLRFGIMDNGAGPRRVMRTPASANAPPGATPRRVMRMPDPSTAIGQSGWIADGIAYIDIQGFPGTPETVARISRFLDEHRDARTLIFDIRNHRGGGLAEMDAIFPRIFARETALVGMDTRVAVDQRRGGPIGDGPTLRRVAGPDGVVRRIHYAVPSGAASPLQRAQIFVLTSHRSGSAAEHFALAMKRSGRATLIGETTAGAGHYGGPFEVGSGYTAFIPVGRSFDPDNNQEWEAVGVSPNVAVPADQALDEALRRAGVDPAQRRSLSPTA